MAISSELDLAAVLRRAAVAAAELADARYAALGVARPCTASATIPRGRASSGSSFAYGGLERGPHRGGKPRTRTPSRHVPGQRQSRARAPCTLSGRRHPALAATYTADDVTSNRIRVLLCDDHELVRRGLRGLLQSDLTIDIVGEAANAGEAVRMAAELAPDVVVLDVRMPGGSGVEACRDIRAHREATRVLILTTFADDEALFSAIMAGASGYVLKQIKGNDLLDGIHRVANGQSLLDASVTARVMARIRGEEPGQAAPMGDLTPQERRIIGLVAEGLTNREIGARMNLAEKTVKNYVSNILMKMGLERRTQVAAFMVRQQHVSEAQDWSP
ncbi:MAG: response regulator transcription factor [Candidatus Dormibacteraeota bacterium]|nr:response regulator transcription factor [Candidatus Dormibacteraeota bacterium]